MRTLERVAPDGQRPPTYLAPWEKGYDPSAAQKARRDREDYVKACREIVRYRMELEAENRWSARRGEASDA